MFDVPNRIDAGVRVGLESRSIAGPAGLPASLAQRRRQVGVGRLRQRHQSEAPHRSTGRLRGSTRTV